MLPEIINPSSHINANKKILVTGASGLLGNELLGQLLQKGFNVVAIYNNTPPTIFHLNLKTEQCNILDTSRLEEIMADITHVYHCAGIVSFEPKDKYKILKINVEGTANVVNACIEADVKKLVHVSSVSALGRKRNEEVIDEHMNWTPETSNSIYGKSKYLGEMEVWRGIGEGLEAVIVNPSTILGGKNWDSGSGALFKNAYNEFKWYTQGINGFVDVRDVAHAMILLMNSEITEERFIVSAENISYKELFSSMAKYFKKNPPAKKATRFMGEIIWRLEAVRSLFSGKKHLVTKETARTAQASVYFDSSKILNALPEFHFTPIISSIEHTCAILKETYHL